MAMIIIWWFVSAHKWFKGPKVCTTLLLFPAPEEIADILIRLTSSIKCWDTKSTSL